MTASSRRAQSLYQDPLSVNQIERRSESLQDLLDEVDEIFAMFCQIALHDVERVLKERGAEFPIMDVDDFGRLSLLSREAICTLEPIDLLANEKQTYVRIIEAHSRWDSRRLNPAANRLCTLMEKLHCETIKLDSEKSGPIVRDHIRWRRPSDDEGFPLSNPSWVRQKVSGAARFGVAAVHRTMESVRYKLLSAHPDMSNDEVVSRVRASVGLAVQRAGVATSAESRYLQSMGIAPDGGRVSKIAFHPNNLTESRSGSVRAAMPPSAMPLYDDLWSEGAYVPVRTDSTIGDVLKHDPLAGGKCPAALRVEADVDPFVQSLWDKHLSIMAVRWEYEAENIVERLTRLSRRSTNAPRPDPAASSHLHSL